MIRPCSEEDLSCDFIVCYKYSHDFAHRRAVDGVASPTPPHEIPEVAADDSRRGLQDPRVSMLHDVAQHVYYVSSAIRGIVGERL